MSNISKMANRLYNKWKMVSGDSGSLIEEKPKKKIDINFLKNKNINAYQDETHVDNQK